MINKEIFNEFLKGYKEELEKLESELKEFKIEGKKLEKVKKLIGENSSIELKEQVDYSQKIEEIKIQIKFIKKVIKLYENFLEGNKIEEDSNEDNTIDNVEE